jgi:hypothetical protein
MYKYVHARAHTHTHTRTILIPGQHDIGRGWSHLSADQASSVGAVADDVAALEDCFRQVCMHAFLYVRLASDRLVCVYACMCD